MWHYLFICFGFFSSGFGLFTTAGFIMLGIAGYVFYNSKKQKIKRAIKHIPVKKIPEFKDGEYARIIGKIHAGTELIKAPFSGRECVYYCAVVKEKSHDKWSTVATEELMGDVIITDGKHYAIVETDEPHTYLRNDRLYRTQYKQEAALHTVDFLRKHGVDNKVIFGLEKTLNYEEGILAPGEFLTVAGYGEWRKNDHAEIPSDRLLILKSGSATTVYISDDSDLLKSF